MAGVGGVDDFIRVAYTPAMITLLTDKSSFTCSTHTPAPISSRPALINFLADQKSRDCERD